LNKEQIEALRATFPWKHRVVPHPQLGALVQVINNRGEEVSILDMVAFLDYITERIKPGVPPHEANL
jgi:hypothetical protein